MYPLFIAAEKQDSALKPVTQNVTNTTHFDGFTFKRKNNTANSTDPVPLIARIHSISSTGAVLIKFNKMMTIPSIYANVSQRRLEPDYNETIDQFLALKVKSGIDDLNPNRTKIIKFNLTDYQKTFVSLQVYFLNPTALSTSAI